MPTIPGLNLDLYNLIYIPLIIFLTYAIMTALPVSINAKKFGPLISVFVGILISILDVIYDPLGENVSIMGAIIRGLIAAAAANGVYDHFKAGSAIIKKNGNT